jgi:polyhydroxyalkanoate synthase
MLRSETAAQPERMQQALKGLRAYQEAPRRVPPAPMPIIAEAHGAQLRDYGGSGPPVLFVPSLINPPNVLDLSEERSMLRWLVARGHHVLLLDWGSDGARRRALSVAGHVDQILLPLIAGLAAPPSLVGYCIGGTMALAAAAIAPARGLVTIAAPWHFSAYPDETRTLLGGLWLGAQTSVETLGVLPMEVLQAAFWSIDPARTVAKFEAFAGMAPDSSQACTFVTLEDWANDGPPLPAAAAREMFEGFFADDLPGRRLWSVAGTPVEPADLELPQLHVVSTTDRIVPAETAVTTGERHAIGQGHVGMVVGSKALKNLWEPLDAWLSQSSAG